MGKTIREITNLESRLMQQLDPGNWDDVSDILDQIVAAYRDLYQENDRLKAALAPFAVLGSKIAIHASVPEFVLLTQDGANITIGHLAEAAKVIFTPQTGNSGE